MNYSGGGLHEIFEKVLRKKHFEKYNFSSVLVLGLGGGDIVSLICEKYKKFPRIVGIEGDATILELADKYFHLDRFKNLEKVHAEAIDFLSKCQEKFDFIVIDLFVDNNVPPQFHTEAFAKLVKGVAKEDSLVIFNKMIYEKSLRSEMQAVENAFKKVFPNVELLKAKSYGVENNVLWCDTLLP